MAETVNTFGAVAMEWHAMRAKRGEAATTTGKRLAHLETHVLPEIGGRPIEDLKPSEVLAMLNKVVDGGSAYTATRLREICGQIFRYAIATDRADRNPAGDLRGALEVPRVKHRPALTTRREFGEFLRNLLTYENCQPMTRLAARLAVLTWTRPVELRTVRWEHFDLEAREWRVPAANMKEGKHLQAHTVPLSAQALSVLAELRALNGERGQWLFPGNHGADSIMSENTLNLLFKRMGYEGKQSHHGLRASARSQLSERGWSAAALETQWTMRSGARSWPPMHAVSISSSGGRSWDDWGGLVAAMERGDNVVPLRPAA
ncbi:tyrosine-type recombinase/integrase [Pseudorhodoferax sp. LjRoot39]|uniref:tyrosine-type recombinase/integrase n=1 Tax=Pseudorhodoferax sp. LjRoot39 TaxID=3342328 RepID=UPI003ED0338B